MTEWASAIGMSDLKSHQLRSFLESLPGQSATALAQVLERERLTGEGVLPHDMLLEWLRPTLRRVRNIPRVMTPLRLFCQPFEDLLISSPRLEKQQGRIARASIMPVWDWLNTELLPDVLPDLCARIAQVILSEDERALRDVSLELYGQGAAAMNAAFAGLDPESRAYRQLVARLGGKDVLADAQEMATVLEMASDILDLQRVLPRPIDTLTDDMIEQISTIYEIIAKHMRDHATYVVFVVLGRLIRPWEIMQVVGKITKESTDLLASQTDLHQVGALLISDLETTAAAFHDLDKRTAQPQTITDLIAFFVQLSNGMTSTIGIRRAGEWGQRLMAARRKMADAAEQALDQAKADILAAVPMRKFGGFGKRGPVVPDLSEPPDPDVAERAVAFAAFLNDVRPYASGGAFSGALAATIDDVTEILKQYCERIIDERKAADHDTSPLVESYMENALRLSECLLDPADTEVMTRRAALARRAG